MLIRPATIEDAPRLWELAQAAHRESRYHKFSMEYAKVYNVLAGSIASPETFCFIVPELDGVVEGYFIGYCRSFWFGSDKAAWDLMIYLSQKGRQSSAAPRLVKAYQAWAKEQGAKECWLGTTTGIREYDTGRFFERMGFSRVGGIYVMDPNACAAAPTFPNPPIQQ